jgi:hypothetical protein
MIERALRNLAARILRVCPGKLNATNCDLEPGHGGRHVGRAGRNGWRVEWEQS